MKKFISLLTIASLLSSCAVGPDYSLPDVDLPEEWSEPLPPNVTEDEASLRGWWENFNDQELNSLIQRAVAGNLDLQLAAARVRQSRGIHGFAEADFGPTADFSAAYTREKISRNNFPFSQFPIPKDVSDLYQTEVDASWEIDIFGGKYRAMQATLWDMQSLEYNLRDVLVSLLAEVAINYATLRNAQLEIAIIRNQISSQNETLSITKDRVDQGIANGLDEEQSANLLATLKSQIPPLEEKIQASINRLSILLGEAPGGLQCELLTPSPLPLISPLVPAGLPSTLLLRRPDIKEAERTLAAETARVGLAISDFYPKFYLTGSDGYISVSPKSLFTYPSQAWNIGPSVQWRIFDSGRVTCNVYAQIALRDQAFINYAKTILNALEEVENALVNYAQERERRNYLEQALQASQNAVNISSTRYKQGLGIYLELLDSQQSLYKAQDDLVLSELSVTNNLIALYKALGGGWEGICIEDDPCN